VVVECDRQASEQEIKEKRSSGIQGMNQKEQRNNGSMST
jgi:hypothetical protein